jgi:hypothetical protein
MKRPGKASFGFPLLVAMLVALLFGTGCAAVLAPTNTGVAVSFDASPNVGKKGLAPRQRTLPEADSTPIPIGPLPAPPTPVSDAGEDSCKRFWEKIGPTDNLPPIIRDCLDITLYKGDDLKLILSLPWLKLVFP